MYVPLFLIQMTAAVITILHKMYKRETKERLARDDTQQSLEAWRGLTNESLMVFFSQEYNFLEMSTREDREKTVSYTMLLLWVEKLSCFRLFEPNSSSTFVVVRYSKMICFKWLFIIKHNDGWKKKLEENM